MVSRQTSHYPYTKTWEEAKYDDVLIVHTSGSTRASKPIYYNHIHLNRPDMNSVLPSAPGRRNTNLSLLGENILTCFGGPFFPFVGDRDQHWDLRGRINCCHRTTYDIVE